MRIPRYTVLLHPIIIMVYTLYKWHLYNVYKQCHCTVYKCTIAVPLYNVQVYNCSAIVQCTSVQLQCHCTMYKCTTAMPLYSVQVYIQQVYNGTSFGIYSVQVPLYNVQVCTSVQRQCTFTKTKSSHHSPGKHYYGIYSVQVPLYNVQVCTSVQRQCTFTKTKSSHDGQLAGETSWHRHGQPLALVR